MRKLRHFGQLTKEEADTMSYRAEIAMVKYAQEIGMSGLSHLGVHNLYTAVQEAVHDEYLRAKRWWKTKL